MRWRLQNDTLERQRHNTTIVPKPNMATSRLIKRNGITMVVLLYPEKSDSPCGAEKIGHCLLWVKTDCDTSFLQPPSGIRVVSNILYCTVGTLQRFHVRTTTHTTVRMYSSTHCKKILPRQMYSSTCRVRTIV
jgi:hypothetical protein